MRSFSFRSVSGMNPFEMELQTMLRSEILNDEDEEAKLKYDEKEVLVSVEVVFLPFGIGFCLKDKGGRGG